ncbi:CCA tRNA nucleotidyltransferase [Provencibacterium massiliense]|uniref:CCA tRNA nucleotidyltransferase n=1 Tax=Provencibacterium massiliense TaxID=1841868 RepID=UPI0009A7CAD4|nr:CCA tRNA nucleotidyltransferase [Provencibacterium massiliense]RGB67574.1 CCA tRNA nucleotidyltransferase [Harryflintia acetispora]
MQIELPRTVERILELLQDSGYSSQVVGGCVRDSLLGECPCDWDVATSATPQQVRALFAPLCRVVSTGERHGTVTLILDGEQVEVTTYRIDGSYSDGRRPDGVRFTSRLCEDLARRDFTVNAMAYSPREGLCDPFGGQEDLQRRVLRCVGEPDRRFGEDALRLLRALRQSAQHGFSVERETEKSLLRNRSLLLRISPERVARELILLLCGRECGRVLRRYWQVLAVVLPGIEPMVGLGQHNPYHRFDVFEHTVRVLEAVPPEPVLRLCALFHDMGKPECFTIDGQGIGHFRGHPLISERMARASLTALHLPRRTVEEVSALVRHHDRKLPPERAALLRALHELGETAVRRLLVFRRADWTGQGTWPERLVEVDRAQALLEDLLEEGACYRERDLALSSRELMALGVPEGPYLGVLRGRLLDAVIEGRAENEREALLFEARRLIEQE